MKFSFWYWNSRNLNLLFINEFEFKNWNLQNENLNENIKLNFDDFKSIKENQIKEVNNNLNLFVEFIKLFNNDSEIEFSSSNEISLNYLKPNNFNSYPNLIKIISNFFNQFYEIFQISLKNYEFEKIYQLLQFILFSQNIFHTLEKLNTINGEEIKNLLRIILKIKIEIGSLLLNEIIEFFNKIKEEFSTISEELKNEKEIDEYFKKISKIYQNFSIIQKINSLLNNSFGNFEIECEKYFKN